MFGGGGRFGRNTGRGKNHDICLYTLYGFPFFFATLMSKWMAQIFFCRFDVSLHAFSMVWGIREFSPDSGQIADKRGKKWNLHLQLLKLFFAARRKRQNKKKTNRFQSMMFGPIFRHILVLLMLQESSLQLRLVVYPMISQGFKQKDMVVFRISEASRVGTTGMNDLHVPAFR